MTSTKAVTPSSRIKGARPSSAIALCPLAPSASKTSRARNRSIVWSLIPVCSGASTSLMIAEYGTLMAVCACSIDTPGWSRANTYAQ